MAELRETQGEALTMVRDGRGERNGLNVQSVLNHVASS